MKMPIICLFWILIMPSLIASFLILTAVATFAPLLYFAVAWLESPSRRVGALRTFLDHSVRTVRALSIQRFAPQLSLTNSSEEKNNEVSCSAETGP